MGKELVDVAKGKALDERTDWIIKEIIQDRVLVEIWEQNQILLDDDTELDFTLLQRESYLIAKSLLMDCFKTWVTWMQLTGVLQCLRKVEYIPR